MPSLDFLMTSLNVELLLLLSLFYFFYIVSISDMSVLARDDCPMASQQICQRRRLRA
jgi:hypothetical protein